MDFGYDAFGRLTSVQGETSVTSVYDGSGLRAARTSKGVERHFVYDLSGPARLVTETDSSNALVAWYVYGLGLLWKVSADGTTYFYHFDGDGNVVAVTTGAKGVVNQYRSTSVRPAGDVERNRGEPVPDARGSGVGG